MDLMRWDGGWMDPVRSLDQLQREINRLFDVPGLTEPRGLFDRVYSPMVDVVERPDELVVIADIPGIQQKDLEITLASNVLTIKGDRKAPEDAEKVYRKETWEGGFQRTIALPGTVDPDRVNAVLKDGVLEIHVTKREEAKARKIAIKAS